MKREIKSRLVKHINFLKFEISDYNSFKILSWQEYSTQRDKRRNVERWIENIVNSSIDIAKIILTSENLPLPDTYKEIVSSLAIIPNFNKKDMEKLSEWVRFRNILVHEYLDIKWSFINRFIHETESLYKNFLKKIKEYIEKRI